jgi:hypothetical protein
VQIRLDHIIDTYILIAYYLDKKNISDHGKLFIFQINNIDMKNIIIKYGKYAHGTKNKYGLIELNNLKYEYALRPKYLSLCWNKLLEYSVDEIII